jgi:ClpP class serine protease
MTRAFNRVWALSVKESTDLRTAALMEGVSRVAEGRKLSADKILPNAEGRIWSGPQGLDQTSQHGHALGGG